MHRHAIEALKIWSQRKTPKPMVLRGARQVGKSTLVKMLCASQGYDLVEINLENKKILEFENSIDFAIDKVITDIEVLTKKKLQENSLIFLDEIQAQPAALKALRYFYEDRPGLKVIAAGSLLEVAISSSNFGMPVGRVEYYYLGPMKFSEFLLAAGEEILLREIKKISLDYSPGNLIHQRAIELLKHFYYVGGMPEAVREYVKKRDPSVAREVQYSLIQTYKDDIPKYSKIGQIKNVVAVLEYCLSNLGKKIKYSDIVNRVHSSYIKNAINSLSLANIIIKTCANNCRGLPLSVGELSDTYKLYLLDIGLFNCYTELEWRNLHQLPANELLTKGNMAEQFVAQHMAFMQPAKEISRLYYWQREKAKKAAEVDFVFSCNNQIFPLEVKSGSSGKLRSLWQYVLEKKSAHVFRLDLSTRKSTVSKIKHKVSSPAGLIEEVRCELIGLPLYAVENLIEVASEL